MRHDNAVSNPVPAATAADTIGRLEPLAVPMGRFTSILRRHFWVVLTVFVLGVGITSIGARLIPKQYTSEATILIQPQRTQVSDLQAISNDSGDVSSLVRTQIDILRSPSLAISVVKALKLEDIAEFAPHDGPSSKIAAFVRQIARQPPASVAALAPEDATQIAAGILSTKLGFANETRSSVLSVSVTTHDPMLSARIANELARQFLNFKRDEKFAAMQRAHDWFQAQMGTLSEQLKAADLEVEQYRQQHRLDELPPDDGSSARAETINRQQLNAVSRQLAEVSRETALKQGQLAQAQAVLHGTASADTLPQVIASPMILQLLPQISVVAGREAQLSSTQGPGNPELAAVRSQLAKLQFRAALEMSKVVHSLNIDIKAARDQEQLLREQMERLRSAVSSENSALIGLQAPQTKARATRTIYESFLNRATQLANVAGIQEQDASLVSGARPPLGPSAPQVTRLVAVAAMLSLVMGVALACLIERLRNGFSTPEQVEGTLGLPLIAVVPKVSPATLRGRRKGRNAIAFTASMDKLRGQMRAMGARRPKIVLVTSALPQEGKSEFAVGLARNAAAAGLRVMLLECDFGYPSLSAKLGLKPTPGMCELLAGDLVGSSSDVIHEPESRLHFIMGGCLKSDPQGLLTSDRMSELLATLRDRYDLVVLDTPPVLPVADALVLASQVDSVLMIVRWEKTARAATQDAVRLLRESRVHIMGVVMTRVDMRKAAMLGGRMLYTFGQYKGYHNRTVRG